jgi:hypothetical protein
MSMINFAGMTTRAVRHADINGSDVNLTIVQANGNAARRIRIISMFLKSSGTGAITFKSDGNVLKRWTPSSNESLLVLPNNTDGWFETQEIESFLIGNASGDTLTGGVSYIEC